jgi:putative lipoprotein
VVTEERCRDSMSDSEGQTELEYRAQVTLPGGKTVRGCCNAGLPPVEAAAPTDTTQYPVADLRGRPETDWSRYLFDLLPAIQACIDKTPEPGPYATKAWPMNRGMVGVRTRNGQGGWFECVAEANGKSVDRFVPLPSGAPPAPNEDRVVFSPPDHPPPPGSCYKHERVMDGMGDFMGWLSTNGCS